MPPSRAIKAFSGALLILTTAVAASAQSVAELKKQAAAGDAGSGPKAQITDKRMTDADYKAFLFQVEQALPKWETALMNVDPEKDSRVSYSLGKAIAEQRDIALMEVGNIRPYIAKQRTKRTVSGELALYNFLEGLFDAGHSMVWMEDFGGLTLSSIEKYAPELGALYARIGNDVIARVTLLEKGTCP